MPADQTTRKPTRADIDQAVRAVAEARRAHNAASESAFKASELELEAKFRLSRAQDQLDQLIQRLSHSDA